MSTVERRRANSGSAQAAAARAAEVVRRWPWWAQVSAIYVAARLVSACIFMAAALHQGTNPWFPAKPDYWNFINIWDARWYGEVIANGYPTQLPTDALGNVQENAWAFYPLFPALARGLTSLTGMNPAASLTIIAMLSGWAAALVVYVLFRQKAEHAAALWGVAFFATFPVSAVLQVPYAEPLTLLLLAAALLLVIRRQYLWAMPVVVLMCLSRPVGVPFAAMLGILFLARLVAWIRQGQPKPVPPAASPAGELVRLAALTGVAGLSALAWPAAAWAATGDIEAYTKTETVWRGHDLVPFRPWFDTGVDLFGPVLGVLAPFVFVALFGAMLFLPPVVRLGVEMRLWCACYMGYLVVFLHPQTSTFRMLLPLFPLALGAVLLSRSRAYRGTAVTMFLLLQMVWIVWLWAWAQLPGGGDYPP
ncbi:integral membrane protein [Pseudarthrobacter chlorophenolicus A6]|uniref:Integral membrane protein n=1 Tax=Pseudarthrobacter chlorophenolicus (strain ATCC 700700 / DSM 12829 / CIP 107037 / JCM 12360 / KCTC 9906 / NCIMB 13794 / A6) TaxID=452863 RepID=B8HBU5_PSECP|nr:glycosyltransferase family 39 protein [Pseudarthrobacter chlorophenolicus]ACL40483.1 integral membrane protein [Pseudarthrobacter chlorophenolicus A6]SDQ80699.1 Dolichyl-phosphate-mannose-protein mannosyltransferase [Pseudarthrobacter chlorophenolicus]